MAGKPKNFPGASEDELVAMLDQLREAIGSGSRPNSIGAADFNVSISPDASLRAIMRQVLVDLTIVNSAKYSGSLMPSTLAIHPAANFQL